MERRRLAPHRSELGPQEARFARLYDRHGSAVLAYALRRTKSAEDAAEVVGETFLIAWRRDSQVPNGDSARSWLYAVARRVLANQRRGERRASQLAEKISQELIASPPQRVTEPDADVILGALAQLTEEDRELLLLIGWEELRPRDAARILGISAVAVRSRLHRARRRLRDALNQSEGSHEACRPPALGIED